MSSVFLENSHSKMLVAALVVGELGRPFSYSVAVDGTWYEAGPVLARERSGAAICYKPLFLIPGREGCADACPNFSVGALCVRTCPDDLFRLGRTCVAACPGELGYVSESGECVRCSEYAQENKCVRACSSGYQLFERQCLKRAECAENGLTSACARPTSAQSCANGIFTSSSGNLCLPGGVERALLFQTG